MGTVLHLGWVAIALLARDVSVGVRGEEKGKEKGKNVFGGHVHQKQK